MTKTKKEIVSEMTEKKEVDLLNAKIGMVAKEMDELLKANNLGLMTYMEYAMTGIIPRVKLVPTDGKETK